MTRSTRTQWAVAALWVALLLAVLYALAVGDDGLFQVLAMGAVAFGLLTAVVVLPTR